MFQKTEHTKSLETDPIEMELNVLSDREFKITVIKMFIKVKRPIHEQSDNFNRVQECIFWKGWSFQ